MTYPLRWYHDAVRETVCWLWGHRWTCSWRRVRDEEPPGWTRTKSGNPYCEYVASWHYKCRRCRLRVRGDAWQPWWRDVWRMVRDFFDTWWFGVTWAFPRPKREVGFGYSVAPWHIWLVSAVLAAPLYAFGHVWLGYLSLDWRWPGFPGTAALHLHDKISWWVEARTAHYAWLPPDSGDPTEIGFWMEHEAAKRMKETGEWRTRIFVSGDVVQHNRDTA